LLIWLWVCTLIFSLRIFSNSVLPRKWSNPRKGWCLRIAVELAGVLNALGSNVQLFIRKHQPLRGLDHFLGKTLLENMRSENINV
jgi:hypothetical protein